MSLLLPSALLFGLIAIPILLMYMLKLRRREVEVSSTLLWQRVLRDRQANTPWQRLKRNLLLLLQLLVLAALVLALARPAVPVPIVAAGMVILVLDASASMNAVDVPPSRFEAGRAAAQALIDRLPQTASTTLILAGDPPQILASGETDPSILRRSLEAARPGMGASNWPAAFALAAGAAGAGSRGEDATLVVISDGGIDGEGLPAFPGEVRYIPVGITAENLALRALSPRLSGSNVQLFASVENYGEAEGSARLSLYAGGRLLHAQEITIPAGESQNVILDAGPEGAPEGGLRSGTQSGEVVYEARLAPLGAGGQDLDALHLDDAAYAVYQPSGRGRVLLASSAPTGNLFLEQILAALPGVSPFRALPGEDGVLRIPDDPFDLFVLDGMITEELPSGNLLLINPPSNPLFEVTGVFTVTSPVQIADSPLARFLDWGQVHVSQAGQVQAPAWSKMLVSAPGGPLVFAGEMEGRRLAVLTFDLHDSDLPLQVTFPVLMANLVNYLLSPSPVAASVQDQGLRPGESLSIHPEAGVSGVQVTTPSGRTVSLTPGEEGVILSDTSELGLYTVQYLGAAERAEDYFAVNLFNPGESNIRPAASLQTATGPVQASAQEEIGQRELWRWLAGTALVVLIVEWWVYHRRQNPAGGTILTHLQRFRSRIERRGGAAWK